MRHSALSRSTLAAAIVVSLFAAPVWAQTADLSVLKDDGSATAVPGTGIAYTITVTNGGPDDVTGATVTDAFPPEIVAASWTCTASMGSTCTNAGSGDISDSVDLLNGGTLTYLVSATIDAAASGTLSNTASAAVPVGFTDPDAGNDSATDSDTLTAQGDLAISVDDGVASAVPGTGVSYTIVVTNSGPSNANGASVTDLFPLELSAISWTCTASLGSTCTVAGSGDISDSVDVLAGGTLTYLVSATIDAAATGTLSNTASVTAPVGFTDTDAGNDSATDSDTLTAQGDLAISVDDGVASAVPGTSVSYTIVVTNSGPSSAVGATVTDSFPPEVVAASWTCSASAGSACTPAGAGDINDSVTVAAGGSVTYSVSAALDACATGSVTNSASVTAPAGMTDPNPGNESASDTDTLTPQVDLVVTTSTPQSDLLCRGVSYGFTITNRGPSCATNVIFQNTAPAGTTVVSTDPDSPICDTVGQTTTCDLDGLDPDESVSVTISLQPQAGTNGTILTDTATVTSSETETNPANNTSASSVTLRKQNPYQLFIIAAPRNLRVGSARTAAFKIVLRSLCDPSIETTNVLLTLNFPSQLDITSVSATPSDQADNTLVFEFPTFTGDQREQIIITAQVNPDVVDAGCLVTSATVSDDQGNHAEDMVVGELQGGTNSGPRVPPDLRVSLTTPHRIVNGRATTQSLAVINSGRRALNDVVLRLEEPSNVQLLMANPAPTSQEVDGDTRTLIWEFASIRAGGHERIRLKQRTTAAAPVCSFAIFKATLDSAEGLTDAETEPVFVRQRN